MVWTTVDTINDVDIELNTQTGRFRALVQGTWIERQDLPSLKREVLQRTGEQGQIKVMDRRGRIREIVRVEGENLRDSDGGVHRFSDRLMSNYGDVFWPIDQAHQKAIAEREKQIDALKAKVKEAEAELTNYLRKWITDNESRIYKMEQIKALLKASRYTQEADRVAKGETEPK